MNIENQPVSKVLWINRDELKPNDYNPNRVAAPELELLKISILEDGWTQPIVCLKDNSIVDGFHRYTVSDDKRLREKFNGMVPIVYIEADPVHKKMSTIRHNRARGQHGILPMSSILESMIKDGCSQEQIMNRLQMDREEVQRLLSRIGSPEAVGSEFGKSWAPSED